MPGEHVYYTSEHYPSRYVEELTGADPHFLGGLRSNQEGHLSPILQAMRDRPGSCPVINWNKLPAAVLRFVLTLS
jgi:hypothetical protein